MDVLSVLGELRPVEQQELGHRSLLLPRFVGLRLFSVPLLSLEDLMEGYVGIVAYLQLIPPIILYN